MTELRASNRHCSGVGRVEGCCACACLLCAHTHSPVHADPTRYESVYELHK